MARSTCREGSTGGYEPTKKSLFVYNPATNAWVTERAMPVASAQGAAGVINGKLYVYTPALLGKGPHLHRYAHYPGTNTWTQRATPPLGNQQPAAGVIDGKLYLAGGSVSTDAVGGCSSCTIRRATPGRPGSRCRRLDGWRLAVRSIASSTWSEAAPAGTSRWPWWRGMTRSVIPGSREPACRRPGGIWPPRRRTGCSMRWED